MALESALLGFLSEGPLTGYELKTRCFDGRSAHAWTADQAQIYRTLERLEKRRLVRSRLIPQRGRPDRRVYQITPAGEATLDAWLREPADPPPVRDPFLLQLLFSERLPDEDLERLLRSARDARHRKLVALRARTAREEGHATDPRHRGRALQRMTLEAAMADSRAAIDWLDDCLDALRQGSVPPVGENEEER